jgi:hypothetical protein
VIVRDATMQADVRLDCWPAEKPVEENSRRFELDALVRAFQKLAQALDRARRQFPQRGF